MKIKRSIALIIGIILLLSTVSACAPAGKSPVGKWYNEKGKCLDVRSDGTWKLESSYGTGTWKYLEDKVTIEFTDYYGDTQESEINEDELGKYIDFGYYGDFYKDSYPSEDKIAEIKAKNAVYLDPFQGIKFEVSGISPYCQISINNQDCSDEAQKYVTYKLDKDNYANGETATITAELAANTGDESYKLSKSETNYKVENQAEYITNIESINITTIKDELEDWVAANVANAIKYGQSGFLYSNLLGFDVRSQMNSVSNVTPGDIYFSSLKKNKIPNNYEQFNMLSFTYSASYSGEFASGNVYCSISAVNIIKYPDGTIKWGVNDPNAFDFLAEGSDKSMENCISITIMNKRDDYNISKVG